MKSTVLNGLFYHRHLLLWAAFLHFGAFAIYIRAGSSCPGFSSVPAFIELSLPAGAWFWTSNVLVAKPLFYLHTSVKYKVEIDLLNMFWTKQCLFKVICEEFNFIEIPLQHGCSHVNLLYIFRTPFPRNTSGWLLLQLVFCLFINSCSLHEGANLEKKYLLDKRCSWIESIFLYKNISAIFLVCSSVKAINSEVVPNLSKVFIIIYSRIRVPSESKNRNSLAYKKEPALQMCS